MPVLIDRFSGAGRVRFLRGRLCAALIRAAASVAMPPKSEAVVPLMKKHSPLALALLVALSLLFGGVARAQGDATRVTGAKV
jgi:hypothetical protein